MAQGGSDEDTLELSAHASAALQAFYLEREQQEQRFAELERAADQQSIPSIADFREDWNASQFWYDDATAQTLARELLRDTNASDVVAVVSAPSVYVQVLHMIESLPLDRRPQTQLLEYDQRFKILHGFQYYDFNAPLQLAASLKGRVSRILVDPPFLSEECQTKAALSARWLLRQGTESSRVIVCTGERMQALITKLYPGTQMTSFEPRHQEDRLSNEFCCFANFASPSWGFSKTDKA